MILVRSAGLRRSYLECARAYFLGMFANSFGLGTVGGDLARALALKPEAGFRAAAFASVVADRIHGLGVLAFIGAIAIIVVRPEVMGPYGVLLAWAAVIGLGVFWVAGPALLLRFVPHHHRFRATAVRVASAFPRSPKPFFTATALSAMLHFLQIFMHILMVRALAAPLTTGYLFATVPVANILSSLPISVQGLGVRESSYLFLFIPAGASKEVAVAIGAIWFISVTITSAVGALIFAPQLFAGQEKLPSETEVEELEEELKVGEA